MRDRIHRKGEDGPASGSGVGGGAPGRSSLVERVYRKARGGGAAGSDPAETFEHATSGGAQEIPHRGEMEHAFGRSFEGVQAYTGRADEMRDLGATAAASGEKVAFASPSPDRALVAHELTHVVQERQAGGGGVHGKSLSEPGDASEIEADAVSAEVAAGRPAGPIGAAPGAGIRRNMDHVAGVGELRAPPDPNAMTATRDPAMVERNSPTEDTRLPFTPDGGWNAQEILNRLGQFDRNAQTDSDADRCVQAVALASHILGGPSSVIGLFGSSTLDGLLGSQQRRPRQLAAIRVLNTVRDRINARTATYGDLSWAQEALHDLFYNDGAGTTGADVNQRIVPVLDSSNLQAMDVWCSTPAEVMTHVNALQDGEQLVVTKWTVTFNTAYDQIDPAEQRDNMIVTIERPDGTTFQARIRRIQVPPKPRGDQLDFNRDSRTGHQLLVYKAGGQSYLYEPELTEPGTHLSAISRTGAELQQYVRDQPNFDMYGYVQINGKIRPIGLQPSPFAGLAGGSGSP